MSNLFYKYLTERLSDYLKKNIHRGDRFFFQMDSLDEIKNFYSYLENLENSTSFQYKHPMGKEYRSFLLPLSSSPVRLLVAATIEGVTPDFMVLLRNLVAEGKDDFKDSAVLFLTHLPLDSLRGGSGDLSRSGMPFNIRNLAQHLEDEIKSSELSKSEKEILKFYLNKKLEGLYDTPSLWDFEDVLTILTQGKIQKELYSRLELFPDEILDLYPLGKKELEMRIEENDRLFQKIRHALTYSEDDLYKFLDEEGIGKILSRKEDDSWKFLDFTLIRDSEERFQELKKEKIQYLRADSVTPVEIWEKREKEKRISLFIFNPENLSEIPLTLEFDKKISSELIKLTPRSVEKDVRRNRISLKLNLIPETTNFFKLIYDFGRKTTINIAVIPLNSKDFHEIKSCSYVRATGQKKGEIVISLSEDEMVLGNRDKALKNILDLESSEIFSPGEGAIKIDPAQIFEDEFSAILKISQLGELPLRFKNEIKRNFPWDGNQVFKQKRELEENFLLDRERKKISQGTGSYIIKNEFYFFLELEREFLSLNHDWDISQELKRAFQEISDYYRELELLPSLTAMEPLLCQLYENFLEIFNREIESIEENRAIINQPLKRDLWNIGMMVSEENLYLTPLHPLNMAYQVELFKNAGSEILPGSITERLKSSALLPFLEKDGKLLRILDIKNIPEWKILKDFKESHMGESGGFLSRIVSDKLKDFFSHFRYLFPLGRKAPLKIKIINIQNDFEIARGLIDFLLWEIRELGLKNITPLEIDLHKNSQGRSQLGVLSQVKNFQKLREYFLLDETVPGVDEGDIMRTLRDSIRFFQKSEEFSYSHISFYKMSQNSSSAKNLMEEIPSSIGLKGLISGSSALSGSSDYRVGFGGKELEESSSLLLKTAKNLNELICNMDNGGKNSYQKNHVLVTATSLNENREMNEILMSSFWVNFIEPNVNLDYFYRNNMQLAVVHYSDQYTSSSQYDSITVSSKTEQYQKLICQYLDSIPLLKAAAFDREAVSRELIRAFNSFNGEWLLRIVGDRSNLNFQREKLSIIAAIKNLMVFLKRENFVWIPISLEEILRVAGSVGLRREDGMFSAKNLGSSGRHSDDLLFIGVECSEAPKIHFYPVEVKIGNTVSSVTKKAEEQIQKTIELLKENLSKDPEGGTPFKNSFYRHFFVQLILTASEKLAVNRILLTEEEVEMIHSVKSSLLSDSYLIDYSLEKEIGAGGIVLFERETPHEKKIEMDYSKNIMFYRFKESRAYRSIIQSLEEIEEDYI